MLVLGRRKDESITISENIIVEILHIGSGHVRIGVTAPAHVSIVRTELLPILPTQQEPIERRDVPLSVSNAYPCHQHGCQDCGKCVADELIAGAGL